MRPPDCLSGMASPTAAYLFPTRANALQAAYVQFTAAPLRYGLTYPGIAWAIWRSHDCLPADLIFHVSYLGHQQPTFTLNFSRGALLHASAARCQVPSCQAASCQCEPQCCCVLTCLEKLSCSASCCSWVQFGYFLFTACPGGGGGGRFFLRPSRPLPQHLPYSPPSPSSFIASYQRSLPSA